MPLYKSGIIEYTWANKPAIAPQGQIICITDVAAGVALQGDLTFSYQHQTKTLIYKGSNVWKVVG